MPIKSERRMRKTISCTMLSLAALACLSTPVHAQAAGGGGGGAPIFTLPNFMGDQRAGDAHDYLHPFNHPQWNVYRQRLEAAAGAIVGQQPTQNSPLPTQYNGIGFGDGMQGGYPPNTGANGGNNAAAAAATAFTSAPAIQPIEPVGATTNVSATVLTPGLVGD